MAAQYRLSAPNADGKQKRHCAIKLNANGRLDNLLSAICRSSPLEAGGGTTSARAGEGKKAAPIGAGCSFGGLIGFGGQAFERPAEVTHGGGFPLSTHSECDCPEAGSNLAG